MAEKMGVFSADETTGAIEIHGEFDLSLVFGATAAGTIGLERSFDSGATWGEVESFTAAVERTGNQASPGVWYRLAATGVTGDGITYYLGNG